MDETRAVAWVESPLQLLAAAEYAAHRGRALDVAMRLGPQLPETAALLLERRAFFSSCVPYVGIPWGLLATRRSWVVGDGYSGQFQLAMATLGARQVTLLDDGMHTIHLARSLAGSRPYERPGHATSRRRAGIASLARDRLLALAARERLDVFSVFADHEAVRALEQRGARTTANTFAWARREHRPVELPADTVLLGAAAVADGTIAPDDYLSWVADAAAGAPAGVAYLPHRREPREVLTRVGRLPGVTVVETGIPVELALAGTERPLVIVTLPSTAAVTLRQVLEGTGSTIRTSTLREAVR